MRRFASAVLTLSMLSAWPALAADWPHLRGPSGDGRADAAGTFDPDGVGLEVAWTAAVGSGYSGVAVADGKVVTMFASEGSDWAAAFDAATGKLLWKHRLDETYGGHDGSDDGPLASPTLGGGRLYALAPRGELFALDLAKGEKVWSKSLAGEYSAPAPHFGFTTTPLYVDGKVVVQVGAADGKGLVAFDAANGQIAWALRDGTVNYQSPIAMTLAGKAQVVAFDSAGLVGVDPGDGKVLWSRPWAEEERPGSSPPMPMDDDRFLTTISGKRTAFRLAKDGDGYRLEELYTTDGIGQSYAMPVYHDGKLYGFRGAILTCLDASTGERLWRSREPGGDGLILVDGHLVIFGAKGNVVVAEATGEGYRERARVQALAGSGLTWPAFADGRIFVRNLDTLAAVEIRASRGAAAVAAVAPAAHAFGRWLQELDRASDRAAKIDAFLAAQPSVPIVEGNLVHFVYRGEAKDVAILGSWAENEAPTPLERVPGTDLFHRTIELEPGGRWEYRYQIDYETWVTDPRNPRTVPEVEGDGQMSELVAPGYEVPGFLAAPEGARGRIDAFSLTSQRLGADKEIRVWLPPGYDDGDAVYPLIVVNDGTAWLDKGVMGNVLDNLVGHEVAPAVVALVPATERWWLEAGGSNRVEYADMLAEELLPALSSRYRISGEPGSRGLLGTLYFGYAAAFAAARHPEAFGRVAVQSTFLGLGGEDDLIAALREHAGAPVRFHVEWAKYDQRNVDRGWDNAEDSRRLARMLGETGYVVTGGEILDSYGWGGWRNGAGRALAALFPKE